MGRPHRHLPYRANLNAWGHELDIHLVPAFAVMPMDPAAVTIGGLVAAGAALLPDADHHNATIAYSIPGVDKAVTAAIGQAAGGHRHGTHSGLSAIAVLLLAWVLTAVPDIVSAEPFHPYVLVSGVIAAAMLCFAVKVLRIVRGEVQRVRVSPTQRRRSAPRVPRWARVRR